MKSGKAIRDKCIDCSGGSAHEVRHCPVVDCPLWGFRMGRNPWLSAKATRHVPEYLFGPQMEETRWSVEISDLLEQSERTD